jgi:spermidine synthase
LSHLKVSYIHDDKMPVPSNLPAELGCAGLKTVDNARVLVGGLGMGFTLAAALDAVSAKAELVVAELIPEVVECPLGECAGRSLEDSRTEVIVSHVADIILKEERAFSAILLDVDNGPEGLTQTDNQWPYSLEGLGAIHKALHPEGILAIWSTGPDPMFAICLKNAISKSTYVPRARLGKGSRHTIFLAQKTWRNRDRAS